MTTLPACHPLTAPTSAGRTNAFRLAVLGAGLGILGAIGEAVTGGFFDTTQDTGPYQYDADYWFTGSALPHAVGAILLIVAIRRLQGGRDGRLGLAGLVLNAVSLFVLSVVIVWSLVAGHEVQAGPTYVLGTLGTFVATGLFAAGSWRVGLVPRWMLAIWPFVWVIGSFFAVSASPLLLVAYYAGLLWVLRRR